MQTFIETQKTTRVSNAVAAGTSDVTSASVDVKGFDACCFVLSVGAVTSGADVALKVQGSHDDTTFVDLSGTAQEVTDDADNKVFLADVTLPTYRYLRAVVTRATQNAEIDGVVAHQYRAEIEPVTHDASVGGAELNHVPISGTA